MNTMQKRRNETGSSWEKAYVSSREMVAENPMTATLVAFGAGAAIGVLIGHMIAGSPKPESITSATTSAMEKFGHQVCDALRSSLPEAIGRHLRA